MASQASDTPGIRLTVEPAWARLEYDVPATFTITVHNLSPQVDSFDLSVVGLSRRFVSFDPARLSQFPGPERSAQATMTLKIPRSAKVPARSHVIGVKAQSGVYQQVSRVEEIRVDFPAVKDLALEPVPRSIRGGRTGKLRLQAINRGSVPLPIDFFGTDEEGAVKFAFEPSRSIVPPFGTTETAVRVKARRPLMGSAARRTIVLRGVDSTSTVTEAQATFTQPPLLKKPVLRIATLLAMGAAALTAFLLLRPQPFPLDNYAGQQQAIAEVAMEDLGLDVTAEDSPSGSVASGLVIQTEPAAGSEVKSGDGVVLYVSTGEETVPVPALADLPRAEAEIQLRPVREAGVQIEERSEGSTEVDIDAVVRTNPAPGEPLAAGNTLVVVYSTGVKVPDVLRKPQAEALALLAELGLAANTETKRATEDESLNATVAEQIPDPGTDVSPGTTVVLVMWEFVAPEPTPTTGASGGGGGGTTSAP